MYSLIRTIAIILFVSLLAAVAAAVMLETTTWRPRTIAFTGVAVLFAVPVSVLCCWVYWRWSALRWISRRAIRLAGGSPDGQYESSGFEELADLERALEHLRETIDRQRDVHRRTTEVMDEILDGFGEGLVAINRDRRVVLTNRRFKELSGASEAVGRPLLEIMRNTSLQRAFDRALRGKPTVDRITIAVGAEERQLELRIFPFGASSEIAAAALLIDVTRLARLERMRSDFLADFSHEVRTPMAGIRAATETLESRIGDPQQEKQLYRIINRQLSRLERLLDDMRQLSDIESGEVVLQKQQIDLKELLTDLCDDFIKQVNGSGPRLLVTGPSSPATVDPTRVQQIFGNLVENALKHARGATQVVVEVENAANCVIGRVTDDGEGIPAAEQERIFSRFYRADPSRAQKPAGTGLGLAIAKHLAVLHGGSISVHSVPGRGASFEVRLPK